MKIIFYCKIFSAAESFEGAKSRDLSRDVAISNAQRSN